MDAYVQGKINASARRVLFTKWVGEAWDEVSSNQDMIIRSFKKTGIAVAIDGSEDSEINIKGLEGYAVDDRDEEDGDDPFADLDSDSDIISESDSD